MVAETAGPKPISSGTSSIKIERNALSSPLSSRSFLVSEEDEERSDIIIAYDLSVQNIAQFRVLSYDCLYSTYADGRSPRVAASRGRMSIPI